MTLSNGNSFSNGQSMGTKGTERECPLVRRLLQVVPGPLTAG
jgi:hypothetical protein